MSTGPDMAEEEQTHRPSGPVRTCRVFSCGSGQAGEEMASGCRRFYPGTSKHVYAVVSSRARGLSLGLNFNPDQHCNFDCVYCEVDRRSLARTPGPSPINAHALATELAATLAQVKEGGLFQHPYFTALPPETHRLVHVAISGEGEPTLCPNFAEGIENIVHLRAAGLTPYFKLVLLTNGSVLHRAEVRSGLRLFTRSDEVWVKLDAGTQAGMDRINRTTVPLQRILQNILELGRQRPVVIQSLFVELDGALPDTTELDALGARLCELKAGGAHISLVQVYSASRPPHNRRCRHLSLRVLSDIAARLRRLTDLPIEVF